MVNFAERSEVGLVRRRQEDSVLALPGLGLFVVADGMGGHEGGDQASQLAVDVFRAGADKFDNYGLEKLFHSADQILQRKWRKKPRESRPGTTLVVARIHGDVVEWASVGDSRIYLWNQQQLVQVSVDDTVKARSPDIEVDDYYGNMLTQAIGGHYDDEDGLQVQLGQFKPSPGSVVLLCTDGLHGYVEDAQIQDVLASNLGLDEVAEGLVEAALRAGGRDNVSVVVLGF